MPEGRRWPPTAVTGARTIYLSGYGVLEENMGYVSKTSFDWSVQNLK